MYHLVITVDSDEYNRLTLYAHLRRLIHWGTLVRLTQTLRCFVGHWRPGGLPCPLFSGAYVPQSVTLIPLIHALFAPSLSLTLCPYLFIPSLSYPSHLCISFVFYRSPLVYSVIDGLFVPPVLVSFNISKYSPFNPPFLESWIILNGLGLRQ